MGESSYYDEMVLIFIGSPATMFSFLDASSDSSP
jgi:hypothetical protein